MTEPVIESINVRMGESVVKLTIEQARQLRDSLNTLLGGQANVVVNPPVYVAPPYVPWRPWFEAMPYIAWNASDNSATLCIGKQHDQ